MRRDIFGANADSQHGGANQKLRCLDLDEGMHENTSCFKDGKQLTLSMPPLWHMGEATLRHGKITELYSVADTVSLMILWRQGLYMLGRNRESHAGRGSPTLVPKSASSTPPAWPPSRGGGGGTATLAWCTAS